jgi:hypothetical protein
VVVVALVAVVAEAVATTATPTSYPTCANTTTVQGEVVEVTMAPRHDPSVKCASRKATRQTGADIVLKRTLFLNRSMQAQQ